MQIANQCQTQKQMYELEPKQAERTAENCLKGCSGPSHHVPLPMEKGHTEGAKCCKSRLVRPSLSYTGGEKKGGSPVLSLIICPPEHINSTPKNQVKGDTDTNAKTLEVLEVHSQRGSPCPLAAPPNNSQPPKPTWKLGKANYLY